jgi:hypothetical protein
VFPSELFVVEADAADDEAVVAAIETPATKPELDADFVVGDFGTLTVLLPDPTTVTPVVAVEADVEVVVIVLAIVVPVSETAT